MQCTSSYINVLRIATNITTKALCQKFEYGFKKSAYRLHAPNKHTSDTNSNTLNSHNALKVTDMPEIPINKVKTIF